MFRHPANPVPAPKRKIFGITVAYGPSYVFTQDTRTTVRQLESASGPGWRPRAYADPGDAE